MNFRKTIIVAAVGLATLGIGWWWLDRAEPGELPGKRPPVATPAKTVGPALAEVAARPPPPATGELAGVSHIADELNAPSGNIRRDLDILNEVMATWQTNFPREGNPVGENAEITAALTGANSVHFGFIPPGHRAINPRGELCDRWGMPFRFHQLSGTQMEISSAGPDGRFGTADDETFTPGALVPVPR